MGLIVRTHHTDPAARAWATRRAEAELKKVNDVAEDYRADVSFSVAGATIVIKATPLGDKCNTHVAPCRCREQTVVNKTVSWAEIKQEARQK